MTLISFDGSLNPSEHCVRTGTGTSTCKLQHDSPMDVMPRYCMLQSSPFSFSIFFVIPCSMILSFESFCPSKYDFCLVTMELYTFTNTMVNFSFLLQIKYGAIMSNQSQLIIQCDGCYRL